MGSPVCCKLSLVVGLSLIAGFLPVSKTATLHVELEVTCPPDSFVDWSGKCKSCTECEHQADCPNCRVQDHHGQGSKASSTVPDCPQGFFPDNFGGCTDCQLCNDRASIPGCELCGVETASQVASGENLEVAEITTAPTLPLFIELPKLQALRNGHSEISADALHAPDPLEQDDDVMYNYLLGAGVIATIVLSFIAIFLAYNVTRGVRQQVHQGRRQSYPYNTSIHYRNQRAVVQLHSFREARRNSPVHYKVPSSRQSNSNQPAIKAKYYKVYLPQKDASLAGAGSQRLTATSSHFVQIHPPAPLHLEKPHQDTRSKATKVAPSTLHCQQHGKPVQSLSKDSNRADVITQTADFSKNFSETTSSQLFHWNSSNTPTSKQAMVTIV